VQNGVTVIGTGTASAAPDVMRLDLAAEARGQQVTTALAGASSALDKMRHALQEAGVDPADLGSRDVAVQPEYEERGRVAGYVARLRLRVTVRDVENAGQLLGDAVTAGGDAARVEGMQLVHADPLSLRALARKSAWRNARAAAEDYAGLAGRALGSVIGVAEGADLSGAPGQPFETAASPLFAGVPVQPGTSAVSVTVQVRWEFA
jgi:uncharacterized protein YggE